MISQVSFRNAIQVKLPFTLVIIFFAFSCSKKLKYGSRYTLTSENVEDTVWLTHNFPENFKVAPNIDSSTMYISISRKSVMQGFVNLKNKDNGLGDLLTVLTGFQTAHNPNTKTKYLFFNGDNGQKIETASSNNFFTPTEYVSTENNLHKEFEAMAKSLSRDSSRNNFYTVISDGETIVQEAGNLNKGEGTLLQQAIKDMLKANPDIQIGILSRLTDFDGLYKYSIEEQGVKHISCKRYLYAFCFFDKRFLPEFDRMCQKNTGGVNSLLNPRFTRDDYSTQYLTKEIDGQPNKATNKSYVAFPMAMKGQDLEFKFKNEFKAASFTLPKKMKAEAFRYFQVDSLRFGDSELIQTIFVAPQQEISVKIPKVNASAIIKVDCYVDFHSPVDSLINEELLAQNINDNTLQEVQNIVPTQPLKTEGLKELLKDILQAIADVKRESMLTNFIQLGKYK